MRQPLISCLAFALVISAALGFLGMGEEHLHSLWNALQSLFCWLPALYAVALISYCGRYFRWRFLLQRLDIGHFSWTELLLWFRGFALTATPAKVGELSRVQLLHERLGYPRLPLVHVFAAERFSDLFAVAALLLMLAPAQVFGRLPKLGFFAALLVILATLVLACLIFFTPMSTTLNRWVHQWSRYLPSGALARAAVPAALISVWVWANEALVLWLLVWLLAPTPITIPAAIVIYLLSGTAGMASSLPGGIGVNEATTVLLLVPQGVPAAVALPIAVLRRLITLWSMVALAAAVGFISLPPGGQLRRDS